MERTVYGVISRLAAVVLVVVGILAIWGGTYAHGYVKTQLSQEKITMPAGAALTNQTMKDHLTKYAGTPLDNGEKAKAYANYYILEHMNASSNNQSYSQVSGQYTAMSKDTSADPAAVKKLGDLRQTLFMGDTLRGLLLSAYGWGLVGTIALWGGIVLVVVGAVLAVVGFGPLRKPKTV